MLYLAISLSSQGGQLTALGRYRDAVVAHVRALEILQQLGSTEPQSLARMGYNAERLGVLLFTLQEPSLAARFDGLALAVYLSLAEAQPRYSVRVSSQLNALCLSLDGAASATDAERLSTDVRPGTPFRGGQAGVPSREPPQSVGGGGVRGRRSNARDRPRAPNGRVLRSFPRAQ